MPLHTCFGRVTATFAVAALIGAACGSSTKSSSSGTANAATAGTVASVLGQPDKATGTPVKVGFISDGKSAAIDDTSEIPTAQASADYVNDYRGGVGGHPIDLVVCQDDETPTGATNCATQMVEDKVVAVLYNTTGEGGSIFQGLQGSNIPLIALSSIDQSTLTKPGAFALVNLVGSLIAGPAGIAQSKGVTHAAVVVIDVPSASGPVKALAPAIYKNAGVNLDVVTVPPGTADMTPQIEAELAKKPGQFAVIGDQGFCTSALKAIKTLGFTGPIVINPECIAANTAASIPGGYGGVTVTTWNSSTDSSTADYKLYSTVVNTYSKGGALGGVAPGGYMVVRAFADVMAKATGVITAAGVMGAFSTMSSPVTLQMGGGTTFQCGTKPVAFLPNICASQILQGPLNTQGISTSFQVLDTLKLMKLG